MPFIHRHPLLAALAVIAAVLAGVIGLELALGTTQATLPPAPNRPAATASKLLPPVVAVAPEQAYPETAARPLFTPTRRPAPEAPSQAMTMPKGLYILQGVVIHGDTRVALLREKSSGRTYRVAVGKEVNGVTLASAERDRVVLSQGADREEVLMTVQKGPPPGVLPQAPVQAQAAPVLPAGGTPANPLPPMPVVGAGPALPPGFNPTPPAQTSQPPSTQQPQSAAAPLTPEEVLARRRARRSGTAQ